MWLHCAPAEDIIVVSEIGEQWSPQTAPARQADIPIIISGSPAGKMVVTIGISMPKVPQDVPVEKERKQATKKIMAGKKFIRPAAELFIISPTYTFAPSNPVAFLRAVANVRIRMAGTIALNPVGIASIHPLKETLRRIIRYTIVITSAIKAPQGKPIVASVSPKAEIMFIPAKVFPLPM